jgi:hypothetical protein
MPAFAPVIVCPDNILSKDPRHGHNLDVKFIDNGFDQMPISAPTGDDQNL